MSKKLLLSAIIVTALSLSATPLFAAEGAPAGRDASFFTWVVVGASISMAIAASVGIWGQSRALSVAIRCIARQPEAANDIRTNLIIGLALIESLVIYVLLVALIIFFVQPFADIVGKFA
jgi:F-type H+-transporting ATPase subunit c